jgi:hypothetical protein
MTYLQGKGGAPILRLTNYIPVKIDGKKIEKVVDKDIFLDELPAGRHTINIRGFRDIQITFKESNPLARVWMNECNRWHIDKYNRWESQDPRDCEESSKGIVGLDFSAIPQKSQASNEPILTRWSKMLATNQYSLNESNITLKMLKNTNYDR